MLDADALRDKIENGHPSLVDAYKKLLAGLEGKTDAVSPVEVVISDESSELKDDELACDKCGKVCASKLGLGSHMRACKV